MKRSLLLWMYTCAGRKRGGGCGFRGRAPVWDTCRMECWERTKPDGNALPFSLSSLLLCTRLSANSYCSYPHSVPFPPSPVCTSSTKESGPSLAWTKLSSVASHSQLVWTDTKSVQELPEVVKQHTESGAQEAAIQIVCDTPGSCRHRKVNRIQDNKMDIRQ